MHSLGLKQAVSRCISETHGNHLFPVKPPAHHQPGKQPKMPGPLEIPIYPVLALSAYAYQNAVSLVLAWGRSTTDLLVTLKELETRRVSLVALNGMAFDLTTPHGRMMATLLAGIAEFERELTQERIRSGIAAAKARGKRLGRQPGQRPKSDRLAPKVLALVAQGRSYRLIGREVGLSKNTVAEIIKRNRAASATS